MKPILVHVLFGSILAGSTLGRSQAVTDRKVDAMFADVTKPGSPGCAVGIYRDGKIVLAKGYGYANLEDSVPITPQTVFDVGSVSKQFTAASILLLEKQEKLKLDDDVRKYVPELPDYSKAGGRKITILQLLNHTSGIRDYGGLFLLAGINDDSLMTDDDALGIIVRQKGLNFVPGSTWQYSNSGYVLLSLILRRITGVTLAEFETKNIFAPLGMTHTHYRDDHTTLIPHRALAYSQVANGDYKLAVPYAEETGDGMLQTSIEDLIKWDENFSTGKVGGKELISEMEQPAKLNDLRTIDYAKGLYVGQYRGLKIVYHGGGSGGYRAYLLRFPEEHFSAACLCNLSSLSRCGPSHASARTRRIYALADEYLARVMAPKSDVPAAVLKPEEMQAFIGTYREPATHEVWHVTFTNGRLWVDSAGEPVELRPLSSTTFEPVDSAFPTELKFDPERIGMRHKLIVQRPVVTMSPTTFEVVDESTLSSEQIAAFAGDYWSDELRTTYRLGMKNGELWLQALIGADGVVHRGTIPFNKLRLVVADEFTLDGAQMTIDFTRDQKGNVNGFRLSGFLERGIAFIRQTDQEGILH
jgi:CubicO group peptidase (beta-lactamase class C family)